MEGLQDFHFLRPLWLVALFIPLLWGWFIYRNERVQSSWADVCDEHLLNFLLIKGDNHQRRLSYVLAVLFMLLTILALAGPTWVKKPNPALSVDNPVMIALSLSSSMEKSDVSPNRLVRARYIIKDFMQTLRSTEIGLEVYSDEPFIISPLTEDAALIDNLLPVIERNIVPADGDRLDRAIDMAVERMQSVGYASGNIIVLAADVGERFEAALESAAKAYRNGFEVNVIKVSTETNEKLQMVAQKGYGVYLNYNQSYAPLSRKINDLYAKKLNESKNMQSVWLDFGYYLFWLPALLLLYYYRRGVIAGLLLCLICSEAYAGWFVNDNQEAMQYFKRKQYDKAAQLFQNAQWRGAAAYKNGDYEQAYREFSKENDVVSMYNQGNALAKAGKIDEAIAKYEEVLKQKPDFEDAKFNLEYLKKLNKNQNQKQNQKQDNKDQQKQQKSGGDEQEKNNQQQDKQQEGNQDQEQQQEKQKQEQQQQQEQQKQEQQKQDGSQQQEQQEQQQKQKQDGSQQQEQQNQEQKQDGSQQQEQQEQNGDNKQEQSQEQSEQSQEQSEQSEGESEQSRDENQNGGKQQSSAENQNGEDKSDAAESAENKAEQNQQQSSAEDKQDDRQNGNSQAETPNGDNKEEQEQEVQVQSGPQDENGMDAEERQVQNGDKDNDKEKMRVRMQKFRDIPEDKGGLLRALIAKEYRKNRYKDEY